MKIRSARFECRSAGAGFAFGGADAWRILVTDDGVPRSYVLVADPGATDDPRLTKLLLQRAGETGSVHDRAVARLTGRLGAAQPELRRPTCTVAICTHQRPQFVAAAIAAVRSLDPPADEIIVVDNAPGERDCQTIAELAGVRYVREERRGLDWARAAAVTHATCDLIAFIDDDVIVSRHWLRALPNLFADASIGAATGVAVGREVETPAQDLRESFAGFVPGMSRRCYDWTNLRPVNSGAAGAGANMIFRRELLLELGDVFPPELDGGTPTRSGGDLYALYRVLASGHRIFFDPSLYAEHRHRAEYDALRETVIGYGTGFASFLTKVFVERRELLAPRAWSWLVGRLVTAVLWQPVTPYPGLVELRVNYLRGGLKGPSAWRRSRLAQHDRVQLRPDRAQATTTSAAVAPGAPNVITIGAGQPGARNAAARASAGADYAEDVILLFLEPGAQPAPDLVALHAERHRAVAGEREGAGEREAARIVVGHTDWHTRSESLVGQLAVLWWKDHFRAKRTAATLTFADLTPANFSLSRSLFERLGGFDERLDRAASVHELAARALEAGVEIVYEPRASMRRELGGRSPEAMTRQTLAAIERAGSDHALVAAAHPVTTACLPAVVPPVSIQTPREALNRLPVKALLTLGVPIAGLLEWCRFRRSWRSWFGRLAGLAYWSAYARAGGPPADETHSIELDIAGESAISPPAIAPPLVRVRVGAHHGATFRPAGGQWGAWIAEQAIARLHGEALRALGRSVLADDGHEPSESLPIDLSGTLLVYGPSNDTGDDRHDADFVAAGARIARASGRGGEHWDAVAQLVAEAQEPWVAVPLPGVVGTPEWLATALVPLAGPRVAGVFGVGVPSDGLPRPTVLASRQTMGRHHHDLEAASQYAVLSTAHLAQVGGIDAATARFGIHAPLVDLIDRLLDAGFVVARQDTPGLDPAGSVRPARSRLAWDNAWAKGGLIARDVAQRGTLAGAARLATRLVGEPLLLLLEARTVGEPSVRSIAGRSAGRLAGCVHALTMRSGSERTGSVASTHAASPPATISPTDGTWHRDPA